MLHRVFGLKVGRPHPHNCEDQVIVERGGGGGFGWASVSEGNDASRSWRNHVSTHMNGEEHVHTAVEQTHTDRVCCVIQHLRISTHTVVTLRVS